MSGNIILDSMKKKETIALSKILEAMKLLGKADPNSEKILDEAEKELGIGNKKKRETGEIKFTVPPHDERQMNNPKMTEEEKTKAYYKGCEKARKHNEAAKNTNPTWILVDKDDECNTRDEDTMLRYLDQKKEVIDWYTNVRNLSSYGARTGYTMNHYKRCIDPWVSYFAPNMRPVTDQMDANEAASYLSSLTLPDNDVDIVEREICNMTRKVGEKLISKMSNLKALAERLYSDYDQKEKEVNVERTKMHGLLCFTAGETRKQLEEALSTCKRNKEKPEWDELFEGVLLSEERYGMPKTELKFQNIADNSVFCFNVDTRIGYAPEPLVNTGLGISYTSKRKADEKPDTSRPPPNYREDMSRENTSGSFQEWRQEKKNESKDSSMETPEKAEQLDEDNGNQTDKQPANDELWKSVCEQLSKIYDNNDKTAINVSKSEEQPVTSTPLPSGTQMTKSGRKVNPPNRLQVNNLTVDVLTAVITENVKKQLGYKRDNSRNRSNSKDRGQNKESRKDQHEGQNKRTDSKNRTRTDSKGQRTNSKSRPDSQNRRPRSFSNRRERTKTWSDTDFAEARGIKCSRDYDPRREKKCLKCLTEGTHHEYECKKYLRRSKYNCKNCNKGFHWAEECDEPRKYYEGKFHRNNSKEIF
jgi:hypothetical protein